jgi:hypothetical protein
MSFLQRRLFFLFTFINGVSLPWPSERLGLMLTRDLLSSLSLALASPHLKHNQDCKAGGGGTDKNRLQVATKIPWNSFTLA